MSAPDSSSAEFNSLPSELVSFCPRIALVLGSGLSSLAETVGPKRFDLPFSAIPGLPTPNVPGHTGRFVAVEVAGMPLLFALGRVHGYEGHTPRQVAATVRLIASLGVRTIVLTNAAGTVNPTFAPGEWMMLSDHINLTGGSPLTGSAHFADMSETYAADLRALFRSLANEADVPLHEGVYACVPGPQYETPAEVRMLRTLGADAVGMSTVFEAIQARALGLRVVAFSCLTNWAAGVVPGPLSHGEVLQTGRAAAATLANLLEQALHHGLPEW